MTTDGDEASTSPSDLAEGSAPLTHVGPASPEATRTTRWLVLLLIVVWLGGRLAGIDPYDPRWSLTASFGGWTDLWRLLGHSFLHANLFHLAGNAIALCMVGPPIERMVGARGLLALFLLGVLVAAIAFLLHEEDPASAAVGASGGTCAIQGAALVALASNWRALARSTRVRLLGTFIIALVQLALIPVSGSYVLSLLFVHVRFELWSKFDPLVIHLMHGVSLLAGAGVALWLLRPRAWLGTIRRARATALTCAIALSAAVTAALAADLPAPVTNDELDACRSGNRVVCADLAERSRALCERGDAQSCHNLGVFTERGTTGPADKPSAALLYRRACDLGIPGACFNLANLILQGATTADRGVARTLFDRVCQSGLVEGCNGLGFALWAGADGPPDIERARRLFDSACRADLGLACRNLAILTMNQDKESGDKPAAELFKRACQLGDVDSCKMKSVMDIKRFVTPAADSSEKDR